MNPAFPSMTADELRDLLAIDRSLARLVEAIDDATRECRAHPGIAGVPEVLGILARFAAELDAAHPADRLLPRRKPAAPALPAADHAPEADADGVTP